MLFRSSLLYMCVCVCVCKDGHTLHLQGRKCVWPCVHVCDLLIIECAQSAIPVCSAEQSQFLP